MGAEVGAFVVSALKLTGEAALIVEAAVTVAVNTAIAYGVNSVLAPKPDFGDREIELNRKGSVLAQRFVFGRTKVFGVVVGEHTFRVSGARITQEDKAQQMGQVILLAGHECDAIESILVDGKRVGWAPSSKNGVWNGQFEGAVNTSPYNKPYETRGTRVSSLLMISDFLGKEDQGADPMARALMSDYWRETDRCQGHAGLSWLMKANTGAFSGEPQIAAIMRGAKVHDPRDPNSDAMSPETWKWTRNGILIQAHYERSHFGPRGGQVWSNPGHVAEEKYTDWDQVADGADICDENIIMHEGTSVTEKRYTLDGFVGDDEDSLDVLNRMSACMGGWWSRPSGVFRPWPGAYYPPIQGFRLDAQEGDFTGTTVFDPVGGRLEKITGVRGQFPDPAQSYRLTAYPEVRDPSLTTGHEFVNLQLPFVSSAGQCQRVASIYRKSNSQRPRYAGPVNMKGLMLCEGASVPIYDSENRIDGDVMLIENYAISENDDGRPVIELDMVAHAPEIYQHDTLVKGIGPDEFGSFDPFIEPIISPVTEFNARPDTLGFYLNWRYAQISDLAANVVRYQIVRTVEEIDLSADDYEPQQVLDAADITPVIVINPNFADRREIVLGRDYWFYVRRVGDTGVYGPFEQNGPLQLQPLATSAGGTGSNDIDDLREPLGLVSAETAQVIPPVSNVDVRNGLLGFDIVWDGPRSDLERRTISYQIVRSRQNLATSDAPAILNSADIAPTITNNPNFTDRRGMEPEVDYYYYVRGVSDNWNFGDFRKSGPFRLAALPPSVGGTGLASLEALKDAITPGSVDPNDPPPVDDEIDP